MNRITPYIPRLVADWELESPGSAHRSIPGTLVFVDISGFTKMSERLARRGKVGSEEVTDLLGSTFTRLLAVAYENDGSLLKFGGDALLLFFTGADHAVRGAHAAAGMRAKLRELGPLASSAGAIRLRMSVGVHSGDFDFYLTGETHRELIVTGPAATVTVTMEHAASAGEILLSESTAASLDQRVLGSALEGGRLLKRAPAPPAVRAQRAVQDSPGLEAFIPEAVREHLAAGVGESEHRRVTIAFLRFEGTDALEPAVTQARLSELIAIVQRAVRPHAVCFLATDVDADGGKIILASGIPQSTDNDEERMLRALREIVDAGPPLPLRIGVNRGHVFVGDVGPAYRRTYTIIGDAVNLAARLMARCEPGEILCSPEVLERSDTTFETTEVEPFFVKGKARPVRASVVGPVKGVRSAPAGTRFPLIGRDAELERMTEVLEVARRGTGGVIEVTGEAGIGKTRLLQEFLERCGSRSTIVATSQQYEASTPYFALRALLAQAGIPESILEQADSNLDPEVRAARLREAVTSALVSSFDEPAVFVFEDAQWMDEASAAMIAHVAESIVPTRPWTVVVARTPDGAGPLGQAERIAISLKPLAPEDAGRLATVAGEECMMHPTRSSALAERSGGHPLFLLQLIAAPETTEETLPESVEALITTRIDRLARQQRTALRYASVLGATFNLEILADVAGDEIPGVGDPRMWRRLSDFVEVASPGVYHFRQALFRDVAYEGLSFKRRRLLHDRAGRSLEQRYGEEAAERLSLHFHQTERFPKAWRYSRLAGDNAKTRFANVEAAAFYRRALEAVRHVDDVGPDEIASVWESLGDVCELAALYPDAMSAYRRARVLAGATRLPGLMLKEGVVRDRSGKYAEAVRWFGRGLKVAESPTDRIRLTLAVATTRIRRGRYDAGIVNARRAAFEAEAAGDRTSLARAYFLLDWAHRDLGRAEGAAFGSQALAIYEEIEDLIGQAHVLNSLGATSWLQGRWVEARGLWERSREAGERAGHIVHAATASNNLAELLSDQGHLSDADPLFRDALRIYRAARFAFGVAGVTSNLGRVASRSSSFDDAEILLGEAAERFARIQAEGAGLEVQARIAEMRVLQGRAEDAMNLANDTLERAARLGELIPLQAALLRVQGFALLQAGEGLLAQEALDESLRLARKAKAEYEEALTLHAWALLASKTGRDASKYGDPARQIFERLGVVFTPEPPLP